MSRPPPRSGLVLALALGVEALLAARAEAQSCHPTSLRPEQQKGLRAEASAFAAGYDQGADRGHYEGGSFTLAFAHPHIGADVTLPFYGLTRDGERERGLGDVMAGVRAPVYRLLDGARERFGIGAELVASFPSGDAAAGLGMGHVMLMPGLFARVIGERFSVVAQLAYGFAVGHGHHDDHGVTGKGPSVHAHHTPEEHADWIAQDSGAHDAGGPAPIVNPMNQSELEHSLALVFQWTPLFALTAQVAGAVPIADDAGEVREVGSAGVRFTVASFDLGLSEELPIVGDPIQHRTVLRVGAQW